MAVAPWPCRTVNRRYMSSSRRVGAVVTPVFGAKASFSVLLCHALPRYAFLHFSSAGRSFFSTQPFRTDLYRNASSARQTHVCFFTMFSVFVASLLFFCCAGGVFVTKMQGDWWFHPCGLFLINIYFPHRGQPEK